MKVYLKEGLKRTKSTSIDYSLSKLFIDQLRKMLWVERAFAKAIPKIINNISSPNLTSIIEEHAVVTSEQIKRLENIFELIERGARGKRNVVIEALLAECANIFKDTRQGPVRDAAIIALVQKIEHYAIAAYGTLVVLSRTLGDEAMVEALNKTITEKKKKDAFLTDAAYNTINFDAAIDENKYLATYYYKGDF